MKTLRKERKLLKKLIKLSKKYERNIIPINALPVDVNNYYLKQLISKNLVKLNNSTGIDPITHRPTSKAIGITITNNGEHFHEERNEEFSMLMLKSFWFPIAVAFITSLLTNGILDSIKALLK